MVCHVVTAVITRHEEELKLLGRDIERLKKIQKPFIRVTYSEAVEILRSQKTRKWLQKEISRDREKLQEWIDELAQLEKKLPSLRQPRHRDKLQAQIRQISENVHELENDLENRRKQIEATESFQWGKDLGGSDETVISRQFDKPLFITHYPAKAKAFYMKGFAEDKRSCPGSEASNRRFVRNMDLLAPEGYGEIIGGSEREDDMEALCSRMLENGLNPEDYDWYLDLRRYGSVPHSGFGLGIERTLAWICGLKHVREAIAFPRTMGRMYP